MIWHSNDIRAVCDELQVDPSVGLSSPTAAARLEEYGENRLQEKKPLTFFQRFLRQMQDTMVVILLIAAAISLAICFYEQFFHGRPGDWIEPIVIVAIVMLNAILGVVQENKAEAALAALKSLSAPNARVRRDGALTTLSAYQLVPGDIVELEAGDLVPADCRILEAYSLKSNESALTGESMPVEKSANGTFEDITPLADRTNMLYASCAVTNGKAVAVVVATGMRSEMGHIASLLEGEEDAETPLQQKMAQLGKILGVLALIVCVIIFIIGLCFRLNLMDMFMTAVSLAVAAIPEGMPAIVTIVLALGVQRMVRHNAIIRRLPAVETLGSASVICSDKTGTLTQNRMTLRRAFVSHQMVDLDSTRQVPGLEQLTRLAALCTDADIAVENGQEKLVGDPTETAILAHLRKIGYDKSELLQDMPRLGELPFDSERKCMTSVHMADEQILVIVKGAPEVVLALCTKGNMEEANAANAAMAKDALRVLAVAYKILDTAPSVYSPEELERDLTLAGLVGMIDPPRPEVRDAIRDCDTAGIRTVMITGDNVITASAIARELGILHEGEKAITGQELEALSEEELDATVEQYRVYARVTPADKIRIVKAWQKRGDVVAMTGDGVNDAPALKAADIGCAMGITGTDVAKSAADMTLTDDNFATIVDAAREGRGIYDNIRKAISFLLSCNLGEILTVFVAMLLWRESPLLPIQLLWINLVTDSLPALALGVEPPEADVMRRRPRQRGESLFAGGVGIGAIWQGAMFAVLTLVAYFIGSRVWNSIPLGETMAFATLAIGQLVHAVNMRSSHSLFKVGLHTNLYMVGAFFASLVLLLAVLLIPGVQGVFSLVTMSGAAWGTVLGLAVAPLLVMELYKLIVFLIKRK
ncbi:MAG: calcium-translocating P-type ATPase, PMCA-type [Clostridia bacterium]|nr:calcium-translocating P-type ATPase, PMCA-type [Clostridia bacterium]